jgi:hypothetical protein
MPCGVAEHAKFLSNIRLAGALVARRWTERQ